MGIVIGPEDKQRSLTETGIQPMHGWSVSVSDLFRRGSFAGERPEISPSNYSARTMSVISTGSTGTSWCMLLLPVFTPAMASTTSIPSTTLPNTA